MAELHEFDSETFEGLIDDENIREGLMAPKLYHPVQDSLNHTSWKYGGVSGRDRAYWREDELLQTSVADKIHCQVCDQDHELEVLCAQCVNQMIQRRRTMLNALRADVAVLRKKCHQEHQKRSKDEEAWDTLHLRLQEIEELKENVLNSRERLCSGSIERIALAQKKIALEDRSEKINEVNLRLQQIEEQTEALHRPILEGLHRVEAWNEEKMSLIRREKVRDLFGILRVNVPVPVSVSSIPAQVQPSISSKPSRLSTIAGLPFVTSFGDLSKTPSEVVGAALGRLVHLLCVLGKFLAIEYIHPMIFTGSFSTIGTEEDGMGVHTLYPDGSEGFQAGVGMLQENVYFLCQLHGITEPKEGPQNMLPNLMLVYHSEELGKVHDVFRKDYRIQFKEPRKQANTSSTLKSTNIFPH